MTQEKLEIIAYNLAALTGAAGSVYERRLAHLCGLARNLCMESAGSMESTGSTESTGSVESAYSTKGTTTDTLREEYTHIIKTIETAGAAEKPAGVLLRCADKIELCRFICGYIGQDIISSDITPSGADEPAQNRISYLRNSYADSAYNIFASVLAEPTVTYASDFAGVCEDVYYGRAKYCILPIENSSDGILTGFRALICKYELNITLTCDVQTHDDDSYTRFALLRRGMGEPVQSGQNPWVPQNTRVPQNPLVLGKRMFEFNATFGEGQTALCDVLNAAQAFGLRLYRVNTLPVSSGGRSGSYNLALSCDAGGLPEFITFLSLEVPQFTIMGIYTHIILKFDNK